MSCGLGDLALAGGAVGPVSVMVRPEQIKIEADGRRGGVAAVISDVTFYGHDAVVGLRLPDGAPVTARVFSHAVPKPGSEVWLVVEGEVAAFSAAGG